MFVQSYGTVQSHRYGTVADYMKNKTYWRQKLTAKRYKISFDLGKNGHHKPSGLGGM